MVMSLHIGNGLVYPVVALVALGACPPRAKKSARKLGCSMWGLRGRRSGW